MSLRDFFQRIRNRERIPVTELLQAKAREARATRVALDRLMAQAVEHEENHAD